MLPDRCIDCGSCIRACPHKAIRSAGDRLEGQLTRFPSAAVTLEEQGTMANTPICSGGKPVSAAASRRARIAERCVAVDGIENVIRMLEEIEDDRLPETDFLELSACTQGCVGGCFTVENPYAARMRLKGLMKGLPVSRNRFLLLGVVWRRPAVSLLGLLPPEGRGKIIVGGSTPPGNRPDEGPAGVPESFSAAGGGPEYPQAG